MLGLADGRKCQEKRTKTTKLGKLFKHSRSFHFSGAGRLSFAREFDQVFHSILLYTGLRRFRINGPLGACNARKAVKNILKELLEY